jgi:tetratricopeptide (TPR) repeat protein
MWRRPVMSILLIVVAMILTLPLGAQQKPLTWDQVQGLMRDGLGDESGAKLIEQRGIDFAPAEDFLQSLKAVGASEAFLNALRAAKPAEPARAKKPLNQVQVFALLVGGVSSRRVTTLVEERGIDFEPTDDYFQQIRIIGGDDELIRALKNAEVIKPPSVELELQAQYVRDEMWDEALRSLKEALSKQQFDPVLRVALGEALFRTGDYEHAIRELGTAKKLDANLWQATQRMADAHLKMWNLKKSLPDRVLASELYQELLFSHTTNDPNSKRLAALFPNWNDDTSARAEAQRTLARLESAAGTWISERGEAYILGVFEGGWGMGPVDRKPESLRAYGTTPAKGDTLSGEGTATYAECVFVQSVEVHISEHSTKIKVVATPREGVSTNPSKPVREACEEVVRKFVGKPFLTLELVRSE